MTTSVGTSTLTTNYTRSLDYNGTFLFDIELWNAAGKRVWQQWDTKNVNNTKNVSITKNLPSGLANGTYSVRGGIFSTDWSTKYLWTDAAGSLTVSGGTVVTTSSSSTTTSTSTSTSTTATSTTSTTAPTPTTTAAPVTTSTTAATTTTTTPPVQTPSYTIAATTGATTFDTTFTSSVNFAGTYLFDIELWNSANQRVFQEFAPQTLSGTKTVKITKNIPTLAAGTYSIRAGIFSVDWVTKYLWTDSAGALVVNPSSGGSGSGVSPTAPTGYTTLAFDDEFNGNALDTTKWLTCSPQMNYANGICYAHDGERQQYVPQNLNIADFSDGSRGLRISATDSGKTWGNTRPNNVPYGSEMYNSGAISTGPNRFGLAKPGYQPFNYKYGYYESRMKVPAGQGYWAAAWSFPADNVGPYELDLVEILGRNTNFADYSYHYPGGQTDAWGATPDTSAAFHTYGVDWQPDHIAWYFDGQLARSVFTDTTKISPKNAYLILNLAVGGNWPGPPDAGTKFPGYMDIDYVRVWTK
jgi:beta-glucanase (GH16 family)